MSASRRGVQFYIILALVLAILVLSIGNYVRWWDFQYLIGPLYFDHWLGFIGAGFIFVYTLFFLVMKRRYRGSYRTLFKVHVFGNLIAFLFVSLHFTHHTATPILVGTGLALYVILIAMVVTGLLQRLHLFTNLLKPWRFIHISLSLSFYIVIVIHVLRNMRFA